MRWRWWEVVLQIAQKRFLLILYKYVLLLCPSLYFFPFENYCFRNKLFFFCLFIIFMSIIWQWFMNIGLVYGLNVVCLPDGFMLVVSSMAMWGGWPYKRWNQRGDHQAIHYEIWEGIMRVQGLSGIPSEISFSHKYSWADPNKKESSTCSSYLQHLKQWNKQFFLLQVILFEYLKCLIMVMKK